MANMINKKTKSAGPKGITIIELMAAVVVSLIIILGLGIVLADSHRGWNTMYDRMYSGVVVEGAIARKAFERVARKAKRGLFSLDDVDGEWVELYYYSDVNTVNVDRYARFYKLGEELKLEYGIIEPRAELGTENLCSNVSDCVFTVTGGTAQMQLILDNGSQTSTVTSSAFIHNQ